MKTFWLSFADSARGGFLGVAIVQVDDDDAEAARALLLPQSLPGAEWGIAAMTKAHDMGCNPGGQVLSSELPAPPPGVRLNRLLTREEALAAQEDAPPPTGGQS